MMRRTEIAVREEIRKIPDGVYSGAAATDDDGTTLDEQVWVRAKITIKGDEMTIDLSESDAQRKGFVNCVYAVTYGIAIAAAILYFDPALADYHNEGTMKPIKVIAAPGSVVNCQYPATVGASPVNVGVQIMEAVIEALSKALPHHAIAAWGKHRGDYLFAVGSAYGGTIRAHVLRLRWQRRRGLGLRRLPGGEYVDRNGRRASRQCRGNGRPRAVARTSMGVRA